MNILLKLYSKFKNPITIVGILILYVVIYILFLKKYIKHYINDNWNYFKDKPYILPFTGFLRGNIDNKHPMNSIQRTIHNINLFFTKVFNSFIKLFTKPFFYFFKLVTRVISELKNTIDKFRNMAAVIRKLFKETVESTVKRISNSYAAVVYFQEKFKLILRKQAAMFAVFKQFAQSMKFLLYSFGHGPVPKLINFLMYYTTLMIVMLVLCVLCIFDIPFVSWIICPICAICFDEKTPIKLNDGKITEIKNLKLKQKIYQGGTIEGIIRVISGKTDMYNYKNTLVSGSHLIFESNQWKRVEDSLQAQKVEYDESKILHCLITENNLIVSGKNKFSDYQETNDSLINLSIQRIISKHLNKGNLVQSYDDICHQYYWGFSENTLIDNKKITDINIGDIVNNKKVLGKVELNGSNVIWYLYKNILVSGSQLVNENGLWLRVHQSKYSEKLDYSFDKMYHLIIENNEIIINGIKFTDFCETCDENVNEEIDNLVLTHKNKLY